MERLPLIQSRCVGQRLMFVYPSRQRTVLHGRLDNREPHYREYTAECSAQIRWNRWLFIPTSTLPREYPQRISTACILVSLLPSFSIWIAASVFPCVHKRCTHS